MAEQLENQEVEINEVKSDIKDPVLSLKEETGKLISSITYFLDVIIEESKNPDFEDHDLLTSTALYLEKLKKYAE